MKCKNCNAQYKTRELKCPYCGTENIIGRIWLIERNEIEQEYEDTRIEMKKKTVPYVIDKVLNRLLVIFVALNFLTIIAVAGIFFVSDKLIDFNISFNKDKHIQIMEQYYSEKDYANLYSYMNENNLFSEDFYIYTQAALFYNHYQDFLMTKQDVINILNAEDIEEMKRYEYRIEEVLQDANDFFLVKIGIYSDTFSENEEIYERCKQDASAFLIGTLELTEEEIELIKEKDFSFNGNKSSLADTIIERVSNKNESE